MQDGASADAFRYAWEVDGKAAGDVLHVIGRVAAPGTHRATFTVRDAKAKVLRSADVEFMSAANEQRMR